MHLSSLPMLSPRRRSHHVPRRPLPRLEALQHLRVYVGPVPPNGSCFSSFSLNDLVFELSVSLSLAQNLFHLPAFTCRDVSLFELSNVDKPGQFSRETKSF